MFCAIKFEYLGRFWLKSHHFFPCSQSLNQLREAAKEEGKAMKLLYLEEAGVCNVPNVQRSWSPLGKPHIANVGIGRKRVNVLGALNSAAGTLAFEVHEHHNCRHTSPSATS